MREGEERGETYTTGTAHSDTSDTTDFLKSNTLESLARFAFSSGGDFVRGVDVSSGIVRVEVLDLELSRCPSRSGEKGRRRLALEHIECDFG